MQLIIFLILDLNTNWYPKDIPIHRRMEMKLIIDCENKTEQEIITEAV